MRFGVALLSVVAACGRIGFDSSARDSAADTGCTFGPFTSLAPLPGMIQSVDDDWAATPTRGGLELYFFSFRSGSQGADIYFATRSSIGEDFSPATRATELDTLADENASTLTDDALDIIFGRAGDMYEATRTADGVPFANIAPLSINSATADGDPFISADGLRLVFASSRIGPDMHGLDLFETTRGSRGAPFATPVVIAELNSDSDDFSPTLSADGLEIFFASRRNLTDDDIYTARRTALDQPFSHPMVVPELSSMRDDVQPRLSLDGATIYVNYNVLTAGGTNADLYSAVRSCR